MIESEYLALTTESANDLESLIQNHALYLKNIGDVFVDLKWVENCLTELMALKEHLVEPDEFDGIYGGMNTTDILREIQVKNETFDENILELIAECTKDRRDGIKELGVLIDYNDFYRQTA